MSGHEARRLIESEAPALGVVPPSGSRQWQVPRDKAGGQMGCRGSSRRAAGHCAYSTLRRG